MTYIIPISGFITAGLGIIMGLRAHSIRNIIVASTLVTLGAIMVVFGIVGWGFIANYYLAIYSFTLLNLLLNLNTVRLSESCGVVPDSTDLVCLDLNHSFIRGKLKDKERQRKAYLQIGMFILIGIPPFAFFFYKLLLLLAMYHVIYILPFFFVLLVSLLPSIYYLRFIDELNKKLIGRNFKEAKRGIVLQSTGYKLVQIFFLFFLCTGYVSLLFPAY
jgi:NADH:ubiquinone oxidoreductase subunit 2 (subunit N)